jgi:hypothetical protein
MSVPLDRLYTFLRDQCDQDIIIYRWFPHGSRKVSDCTVLELPNHLTEFEKISTLHMVCHDQEPLDFDMFVGTTNELMRNLTYNRFYLYDKMLLCHSEKHSPNLAKFEQKDAVGVYWWCHAVIARDWFRFAKHDQSLLRKTPKQDFLIYNRAWSGTREYRLKFAEMLVDQGLASNCNMGFCATDSSEIYSQHQFKNPNLSITRKDLEQHFFNNHTLASASADYVAADYQQTNIEVVLETLFDDGRWHLTEKILRPIACRQPFMLAATPGSLEYLRSYGFKTLGSLIDETYDTIQDPVQRLQAIVTVMKDIVNHPNKNSLLQQMQEIADFNQQWFFSQDFHHLVVNEYVENLNAGIAQLDQYHNGRIIKKLLRTCGSVDKITANTLFTRQDLKQIWTWLNARS